jgi:PIN domain nuclease of toxin-antitoxin system
MRLLLDTHVLLAVLDGEPDRLGRGIAAALTQADSSLYVSVASLWEVAIKARLGKLDLRAELQELPILLASLGLELTPILPSHALREIHPEPATRDPFDRLLLAQCAVEGARLLTIDPALVDHPMSYPTN